jgi:hypothetical protein
VEAIDTVPWSYNLKEEREQLSRQAIFKKAEVLGKEHPGTLSSIDQLASILEAHGKYQAAEAEYRQVLIS